MSFSNIKCNLSVIIPYYNHINYIDDCLQSIRDQDFENIEIDFNDNSINIIECCSVFVREERSDVIEELYKNDIMKMVIKDNYILYIIC